MFIYFCENFSFLSLQVLFGGAPPHLQISIHIFDHTLKTVTVKVAKEVKRDILLTCQKRFFLTRQKAYFIICKQRL